MTALDKQVGGSHYKDMAIQPFEYIHKNGLGFAEGCVIKYVSRYKAKNGIDDLKKARHFLDLLIEAYEVAPQGGEATGEGEWIEWGGGECPVNPKQGVMVRLRDGTITSDIGELLRWSHSRGITAKFDIVAYKPVE